MGFSNTSEHVVCVWMKIPELHGIKSPRDIQKTKPKLFAIEPTLIAIPSLLVFISMEMYCTYIIIHIHTFNLYCISLKVT